MVQTFTSQPLARLLGYGFSMQVGTLPALFDNFSAARPFNPHNELCHGELGPNNDSHC